MREGYWHESESLNVWKFWRTSKNILLGCGQWQIHIYIHSLLVVLNVKTIILIPFWWWTWRRNPCPQTCAKRWPGRRQNSLSWPGDQSASEWKHRIKLYLRILYHGQVTSLSVNKNTGLNYTSEFSIMARWPICLTVNENTGLNYTSEFSIMARWPVCQWIKTQD